MASFSKAILTAVFAVIFLSGCTFAGGLNEADVKTLDQLGEYHCKELGGYKSIDFHRFMSSRDSIAPIFHVYIYCNNGVEISVPYYPEPSVVE